MPTVIERRRRLVLGVGSGVFALLLTNYAFWWHGRDWNAASRLMLVYALGDRGTIRINGLETQTGDLARVGANYYTEKQPGYSVLGLPIYLVVRAVSGLEPHPVGVEGFPRWPADYWVTLGVSGVATAWTGALLSGLALRMGSGSVGAILVGLGYGLATPAAVYATLAYSHPLAAALLLTSAVLIGMGQAGRGPSGWAAFGAGFLASYAGATELAVGPVCAILGIWFIARTLRSGGEGLGQVVLFGLGVLGPALMLLGYNTWAFGNPLDTGYAHLILPRFRELHTASNPLGLTWPRWDRLGRLLWGEYRGLLFYAPMLLVAPWGWWRLAREPRWRGLAATSVAAVLAVLGVNLSYPEWTGGWTTGPRLLVPGLPFAMVGVAGVVAGRSRLGVVVVGVLTVLGLVVAQGFQGVGGRVPETYEHPFQQVVVPHWTGRGLAPGWVGDRFGGNLVTTFLPWMGDDRVVPPSMQWLQFVPLWLWLMVGTGLLVGWSRRVERGLEGGCGPVREVQAAEEA
ncbi:MAG: hypothetical protein KatS3mg108_2098 [Isosphaeraceae bacterium]|nr:MAG: hypothetical protein KatS3mg108_2098 [Isosphaeraceae bacterium]